MKMSLRSLEGIVWKEGVKTGNWCRLGAQSHLWPSDCAVGEPSDFTAEVEVYEEHRMVP